MNISIPESIERWSNDLLHHIATLTMLVGLLYAVMIHDILQQIQVMDNGGIISPLHYQRFPAFQKKC